MAMSNRYIMGRGKTNRKQKTHLATVRSLSPDEAREEYFPQIGRDLFYRMLRENKVPNVRFGKKIIIPGRLSSSGLKDVEMNDGRQLRPAITWRRAHDRGSSQATGP